VHDVSPHSPQIPGEAEYEPDIEPAVALNDLDTMAGSPHVFGQGAFLVKAAHEDAKPPERRRRREVADEPLQTTGLQAEDDVDDEGVACHGTRMR
jgi:hypothetical protein